MRNTLVSWMAVAGLLATTGCAESANGGDATQLGVSKLAEDQGGDDQGDDDCEDIRDARKKAACVLAAQIKQGQKAFDKVLHGVPEDNRRACATCHIESDHTTLSPTTVAALKKNDPLFNRLDADDQSASIKDKDLKYEHLKRGLVRVTLTLPANTDLIALPPANPDPTKNLELATAFTDTYIPGTTVIQPGSAQWWWDNLVVKGTHQCEAFRTPGEPVVDVAHGQQYEIITPCDRKVSVWRAVPSVENTAYTAPYLFDGRASTLQEQAQGAFNAHSAFVGTVATGTLDAIAAFEKTVFAGGPTGRGAYVNSIVGPCMHGTLAEQRACLGALPDPERVMPPTVGMTADQAASWERGKQLYDQTCAACHGSVTDNRIMNRPVHDGFFPAVDQKGYVTFSQGPLGPPDTIDTAIMGDDEFINIATPFIRYAAQLLGSAIPPGQPNPVVVNAGDVDFPKFRMRFYTSNARTVAIADLPPLPFISRDAQNQGNALAAIGPSFDPVEGRLKIGPNIANQLYSPDPGRALITGNYYDFEAFDVNQLRGISKTAPYFHDNQSATLADVVSFYSKNVFPFIAGKIGLPQPNPVIPGVPVLSATQEQDLVTFLQVF